MKIKRKHIILTFCALGITLFLGSCGGGSEALSSNHQVPSIGIDSVISSPDIYGPIISENEEKVPLTNLTLPSVTTTYDGEIHSLKVQGNIPQGVNVRYTNNHQTEAGTYQVTAHFVDTTNKYLVPEDMHATLTINKAIYDLSHISLPSKIFSYDGLSHKLEIKGALPEGVEVRYSNNALTNIGKKTVQARFIHDNPNFEPIDTVLEGTLIVNKGGVDLNNISFENQSVTYDKKVHYLKVDPDTLPAGLKVQYENNGHTDAGQYVVTAHFIDDNNLYEDIEPMSAILTIEQADFDLSMISFVDTEFTYDGTPKTIEIKGQLPSWIKVSYENNTSTNAGTTIAKAKFTHTNPNYKQIKDLEASLVILKRQIEGVSLEDGLYLYDGQIHSLSIKGTLPEGVSVVYHNNQNFFPGIHEVKATFVDTTGNYDTSLVLKANINITKEAVNITFVQFDQKDIIIKLPKHGSLETLPELSERAGYTSTWEQVSLKDVVIDTTVNALYTPIDYDIIYHLNQGRNPNHVPTIYNIESTIELPTPHRNGYVFVGWYLEETFDTKVDRIEPGRYGELNLYAKYELKVYTITYHLDGGSINGEYVKTYTIKDSISEFLEPTKLGYNFIGYYEDPYFGYSISGIREGSFGDLNLYAKYEVIYHKVQLYYDDRIVTIRYTIEDGEFIIPEPMDRPGYENGYWQDPENNMQKITSFDASDLEDKIFYAHYDIVTYHINYHLDGGELMSDNPKLTYQVTDETFNLEGAIKKYYTFYYWATDQELNNRITEVRRGTTGDIDLYPFYRITTNYIHYECKDRGIIDHPNDITSFTYLDEKIILQDPSVYEGYYFEGWFNKETGERVEVIDPLKDESMTLICKVSPIEYTLTFETNGGILDTYQKKYNVETGVPLYDPTRDNYTFLGWYLEPEFKNKISDYFTGRYYKKDTTIYAKWEAHEFNITYHLNEGINSLDNPSIYTQDTKFTFEDPTRSGYEFLGWYLEPTFENKIEELNQTFGHLNLYAKWRVRQNKITYILNGGINSKDNQDTFTYFTPSFLLNAATKNGSSFLGWYLDSNFETPINKIDEGQEIDLTLYARFEDTSSTFNLALNSEGTGYEVVSYLGQEEVVIIPSTYNSLPVVSIKTEAFKNNTWVKKLYISREVTTIEDHAFDGTKMVVISYNDYLNKASFVTDTLAYIPNYNGQDGVTSDGFLYVLKQDMTAVIYGYTHLQSNSDVSVPDSIGSYKVTEIAAFSFVGLKASHITLPSNLVIIGNQAFAASSLLSITLPDTVNSIGTNPFSGSLLNTINFGRGINQIRKDMFLNLKYLKGVFFKDNITSESQIEASSFATNYNVGVFFSVSNIPNINTKIGGTARVLYNYRGENGMTDQGLFWYLGDKGQGDIVYGYNVSDDARFIVPENEIEGHLMRNFESHTFDSCPSLEYLFMNTGTFFKALPEDMIVNCPNLIIGTQSDTYDFGPTSVWNKDRNPFYDYLSGGYYRSESGLYLRKMDGTYMFARSDSDQTTITIEEKIRGIKVTSVDGDAFKNNDVYQTVYILGDPRIPYYTFENNHDAVCFAYYSTYSFNEYWYVHIKTIDWWGGEKGVTDDENGFSWALRRDHTIVIYDYKNIIDRFVVIPDQINGYPVTDLTKDLFLGAVDQITVPGTIKNFDDKLDYLDNTIFFVKAPRGSFYKYRFSNTYIFDYSGYLGVTEQGIKWALVDGDKAEIYRVSNQARFEAFPDFIEGHKVIAISDNAMKGCSSSLTPTLPKYLERIGDNALDNITYTTPIVLPETLVYIGQNNFSYCSEGVYVPNINTEIDSLSFEDSTIYLAAPYDRYFDTNYNIIYWDYKNIDVSLDNGLVLRHNIARGVYEVASYDSSLPNKDLVIPSSYNGIPVTTILPHVFANANNLETILIPSSINNLSKNAFASEETYLLLFESFKLEDTCDYSRYLLNYANELFEFDNVKYALTKDNKVVPYLSYSSKITIAASVAGYQTNILPSIFKGDQVTNLSFASGITKLPGLAFDSLNNIEVLNLPDTLESIETYTFGNLKVTTITIPSSLKYAQRAFCKGLENLKEVYYNTKNCTMGRAFGYYGFTIYVSHPRSAYPNEVAAESEGPIIYNYAGTKGVYQNLKWALLNDGSVAIYDFDQPTKTKSLVIPETIDGHPVKEIASYAFVGEKIESVKFNPSLEYIGKHAFDSASLTHLDITPNIKYIDDYAFNNMSFQEVFIPKTCERLGSSVFYRYGEQQVTMLCEVKEPLPNWHIYFGQGAHVVFDYKKQ